MARAFVEGTCGWQAILEQRVPQGWTHPSLGHVSGDGDQAPAWSGLLASGRPGI